MLLRLTVLSCAIAFLASAQLQPHFGVTVGVPLTDTLSSNQSSSSGSGSSYFSDYNSKTKRLLIGPSFRLDLPLGLGLEFDAIYQRVDYDSATLSTQTSTPLSSSSSFQQTTANRWQFPFLLQYSHAVPLMKTRAFVEFGPAISYIDGGRTTVSQTTTSYSPWAISTSSNVSSYSGQGGAQAGITLGGGVDLTVFHLHLRPQLRYSHWFPTTTSQVGVPTAVAIVGGFLGSAPVIPIGSQFRTQSNEASFLIDLLF